MLNRQKKKRRLQVYVTGNELIRPIQNKRKIHYNILYIYFLFGDVVM